MYHLSIIFLYESQSPSCVELLTFIHDKTGIHLNRPILIIKLQGVSAQPPELDAFIQVYLNEAVNDPIDY